MEISASDLLSVRSSRNEPQKFLHLAFVEGFTYTDIVITVLTYGSIVIITYVLLIKCYALDSSTAAHKC